MTLRTFVAVSTVHLRVMAFGNRSIGGQGGGSKALSPSSPDLPLLMKPPCLVTMATGRVGVTETAKSRFLSQIDLEGVDILRRTI